MKKIIYFLWMIVLCSDVKSQWQPDIHFGNSYGYTSLSRSIAASNNLVHVVWHDFRNSTWEIYYKRSTDGGANWEPDLRLTNNAGQSDNPSIYTNGLNVYVVWHDNSTGYFEIYFKRSTDGGISWSPDLQITYSNYNTANLHPSLLVSDQFIHVTWHDSRDGNLEIYYKHSTDNGISWGTDTRLTNSSAQSEFPSISGSGSNINVVWKDSRDGNNEIYFKRSSDNGVDWSSDIRISDDPGDSQFPCVTTNGSNVHIVWDDNRFGNHVIFYKNSSEGGLNWGNGIQLTSNNLSSRRPSIISSGTNLHLAWFGSNFQNNIIYKNSSNSGMTWNTDTYLSTIGVPHPGPSITVAGQAVHMAWTDNVRIFYKQNPIQNSSYTILSSPNGGNYFANTVQNITWSSNFSQNIKLELTTNNGNSWSTINSNYSADSGRYLWTVPNITSSQCKIKISDVSNPTIYDVSDSNFTIAQPVPASALDFDGIYDYVQLPDSLTAKACSNNTAITIEYWFKGSNIQSAVRFQNGNGFLVAGWNGLHIISSDGSVENGLPVGATATDGNWHHVAMTWKKSSINGFNSYLDGNLVASRNSANANLPDIIYGGFLGCYGGVSEFMTGKLDEVRIWNRALSQTEIQQSMNCEIPTSNYGLLANYHFNQGIVNENNSGVTTLTDFSGNSYHGNLTNFALVGSSSNWIAPGGISNGTSCTMNLSLLRPNGGEKWYNGHSNEIVWNTSGSVSNLKIDYSKNNGSTWNTITSSYPAANYSYSWTIPGNINSSQCKIKISDASNPNVYDISDSNFSITPVTLNAGLVVYYPFDNNFNDASGNGFNATPNGNPTFNEGVIGNSVNLIGDQNNCVNYSGGDRIRTPIFDFLSMNSFTISFWVYDTQILCGAETYFFQGDDWSPNRYIGIWHFYESIAFSVGSYAQQSNQNFFIPFRETDRNRFVLYTMTYSNGVLKAYRDAEYLGSFIQTVGYSSHYSGLASHGWYSGGTSSARFVGKMDDFRIYNRELSQPEIQQLYNQAAPIIVNSPSANENLIAGSSKIINWSANSGISNVKIEFSSNNGSNWNTLSNSFPASNNSYQWTVSNTNSNQCKIRISNTANLSVKAESGVFTITQNNQSQLINFKIKDETGLVKKLRIESDADELTKNVVSNEVKFSYQEIRDMDTDNEFDFKTQTFINYKIRKILLYDQTGYNLKGHINFNYSIENINSSRSIDAVIYVDIKTASMVEFNENPGWEYFSNSNEHLVYLLLPPCEKFDSVKFQKKPLLFVHGGYGIYPYWGNSPKDIYLYYDGWQLYYPYDMRIRDCSYILKKSINKILAGEPTSVPAYQTQLINITAHSMGGLVSRYYIQEDSGQKVNKLLMLGTPNYGLLGSYRLRNENGFTSNFTDYFLGKDKMSPAHIDMTPASDLLNYLKSSPIKQLNNRSNYKSYLVIAGNKSISGFFFLHHESFLQDDGVVAVSSASLLNYYIPLATKHLDHTELPVNVPSVIINDFMNENYNPYINSTFESLLLNVNGFYLSYQNVVKPDENQNFDKTKGILYFTIPGIDFNSGIKLTHDQQTSFFLTLENSSINSVFFNRNPQVDTNYFVRNNYNDITGALGLYLGTINNEVKFTFRRKYRNLFGFAKFYTIPISANPFEFKPLQTNWITLNLTESEKHLIKTSSYLFGAAGLSNNNFQNSFYLDNSIDTIAFCISGNLGDTAFNNHNFKLTDPNNVIIDSVYASQHSNVIYRQSIEDAIAYYYIVNPEPGNWSAQFNPNITDPFLIVPIQSPVNPDLFFPDTVYAAGDTIKFFTTRPVEPGISNLQYTANITFVKRGTSTVLDLGTVIMKKEDYGTFSGQFFARGIGEYNVKLILNCTYNNQSIQRENYNSISVASLRVPVSLFPGNDSISVSEITNFVWNKNYNSDKYELQIYKLGDTIPAYHISNIVDTTYQINSLERETSYLWRIRALNNTDTSDWSEAKIFNTIVNPPDNVDLISPPNNSGGLFTPLSFQWSRSVKAEKYHYQISTDSLFENLEYNDSTIADTIVTISDLNFPQKYFWRLRALNVGGYSDFSETWTFNTIESAAQSFVYVNVIPQGLYNISTNSLQRSDTLKAYLVNTSSPYDIVDSSVAVLDSTLFQAIFAFSNTQSGIYYLKIKHHNSIETWSKEGGEAFNMFGKTYYDFSSAATQAYGNNMILSGDKWCIYSGDVDQDGLVDLNDIVDIYNDATIFASGYLVSDLNGDNYTDLSDLLLAFNNSTKFVSKITP